MFTRIRRVSSNDDDFNGKRPFGNSGWKYNVYAPLTKAGLISGSLDDDGYVESLDAKETAAEDYVQKLIDVVFYGAPKNEQQP